MKNQFSTPLTAATVPNAVTAISLHQLIKKLQLSLISLAANKRSFVINAIDKSINVFAEENTLAYIMGSLLSNAVNKTSDCCIRVETELTEGLLQIRILSKGKFAYSSYTHCLTSYADIARKSGWYIGVDTDIAKGIAVVFSMARNAA